MKDVQKRCGNCKFYQPSKDKGQGTCGEMATNTKMCFGEANKKDIEVKATYVRCAMWEPKK